MLRDFTWTEKCEEAMSDEHQIKKKKDKCESETELVVTNQTNEKVRKKTA